ncbi:MAG: NAD-dependent epimerase/dehydratase family protein [Verrucomicrobiota bacterium]
MKTLMIGGTHFIGTYIARELIAQGHAVVLMNRGRQKPLFDLDVESILCDKREIVDKRLVIDQHGFDLVIDMMANSMATSRPVFSFFEGRVDRLCMISSCDVYRCFEVIWKASLEPINNTVFEEESPLRNRLFLRNLDYKGEDPNEMYDKIPVEAALQKMEDTSWTICRLPAVYGPGDWRFKNLARRILDQRTDWVIGKLEAAFCFTHGFVENVARAVVLAATREEGRNEIFNIGELDTPSCIERYTAISRVLDHELNVHVAEESKMPWIKDKGPCNLAQQWVVSSQKIRDVLGFQETFSQEESYRRTMEWEMENQPDNLEPEFFNYEAEDRYLRGLSSEA